MTAKIRYVALGLLLVAGIGTGTYVGWTALSGDESPPEERADKSWGDSWTEAEAEAPASEETEPSDASEPSDESDDRMVVESDASEPLENPDEPEETDASDDRKIAESGESADRTAGQSDGSEDGETVPTNVERVDEPADQVAEKTFPGQQRGMPAERKEYKPAVLQIVTNFSKADVTVNGLPYPEYKENDDTEEEGMVLPAGGPYNVEVTYDGKKKTYTVTLRPYEVRVLMVELSGFKGGKPSAPQTSTARPSNDTAEDRPKKNESEDDEKGRVTVYSKPKGAIQVDGEPREQKTPGTVEVEPGQHDIQVEFDDGEMSESKTVRVRKGSRIKLFFRKKD